MLTKSFIKVYEILWNFMKSWETPRAKDCNGIQPEVAGWCRGCWNKGGTRLENSDRNGIAKVLRNTLSTLRLGYCFDSAVSSIGAPD